MMIRNWEGEGVSNFTTLIVKGFPKDLYWYVKMKALQEGKSIKQYLIDVLDAETMTLQEDYKRREEER